MTDKSYSAVDEKLTDFYDSLASDIELFYKDQLKKQIIIGIAGAPGVGKSTISMELINRLQGSIIVPMDGYHFSKQQLLLMNDPSEALRRRGSPFTFDGDSFLNDLKLLSMNGQGYFPSFDHTLGDPKPNDIIVDTTHRIVIVEGNYLLLDLPPWNKLQNIFDCTYFIDCEIEKSMNRVVNRHMKSFNLSHSDALEKANYNDLPNSQLIHSYKSRATKILLSN